MHAEFAVSLAHDADHVWDFGFVHSTAALVPPGRGDRDVAAAHVAEALARSEGLGIGLVVAMAVTAKTLLHTGQEDWSGVLAAVEQVSPVSLRPSDSHKIRGDPSLMGGPTRPRPSQVQRAGPVQSPSSQFVVSACGERCSETAGVATEVSCTSGPGLPIAVPRNAQGADEQLVKPLVAETSSVPLPFGFR